MLVPINRIKLILLYIIAVLYGLQLGSMMIRNNDPEISIWIVIIVTLAFAGASLYQLIRSLIYGVCKLLGKV